jgi:hypothetical protein
VGVLERCDPGQRMQFHSDCDWDVWPHYTIVQQFRWSMGLAFGVFYYAVSDSIFRSRSNALSWFLVPTTGGNEKAIAAFGKALTADQQS